MAMNVPVDGRTVSIGDTVRIEQTITEEGKTRSQVFEGILIAIRGRGDGRSIVVRKIGSGGIGVEKSLPIHSPSITKISVIRHGKVRRAKLYYLRGQSSSEIKRLIDERRGREPETSSAGTPG